jgi:hypothetical protein
LTAGKEPEMEEKMIAIYTRAIPWEEGYNEKLGRMLSPGIMGQSPVPAIF